MERKENLFQPPEYPAEMFAEYFESAKAKALRVSEIEAILGDDYDLDRLRELVQSDRDGRCVVLLSNDDVYTIRGDIVNGIIKANCRDACKPPEAALKGDQHENL